MMVILYKSEVAFPHLTKELRGYPIEIVECSEAKEYFGGKLTCDFIAEKFSQIPFNELRSLDLPQCSIRFVDLGGIFILKSQVG